MYLNQLIHLLSAFPLTDCMRLSRHSSFHSLPLTPTATIYRHQLPLPPVFTTYLHRLPSPSAFTTSLSHQPSPPAFTTGLHHLPSPQVLTTRHHWSPSPLALTTHPHRSPLQHSIWHVLALAIFHGPLSMSASPTTSATLLDAGFTPLLLTSLTGAASFFEPQRLCLTQVSRYAYFYSPFINCERCSRTPPISSSAAFIQLLDGSNNATH